MTGDVRWTGGVRVKEHCCQSWCRRNVLVKWVIGGDDVGCLQWRGDSLVISYIRETLVN